MIRGGEIQMNKSKTECVLICLSPSPANSSVINAAVKIAGAFNSELKAFFVETPAYDRISEQDKIQLDNNKKLAVKSGAKFSSSYGSDVAMQIAEYAKACNATKIVIGRSNQKKKWAFSKNDIPQRLSQLVPEIEIYIIPCYTPAYFVDKKERSAAFSWHSVLITIGLLLVATLTGLFLKRAGFTEANIITVYILSVLLISFLTEGYAYGITASILSVLVFNFLFTEPRFSFRAYETGYPLTFFVMLTAAFLTSSLTVRAKGNAKSNAQKAYRTEVLLTASRNLQHAEGKDEILNEAAAQILKLTGRPVILYPVSEGKLEKPLMLYPQGFNANEIGDDICQAERPIAERVYVNNEQAGATTKTDPGAQFWYLAVRGNDSVHAVAGVAIKRGDHIGESERDFLLALLGECGVAMEKQKLRENQMSLAMEAQREKTRSTLLRAISHDLRTPLTSISGNAELLMEDRSPLNDKQKNKLYADIYDDSIWLISLVENLLSITRIDNETLALNLKPELISDVIDEAVMHTKRRVQHHNLSVSICDELLMVKVDMPLIVQVLVNLIDNAVKYTPEDSDIIISVVQKDRRVFVSVADDGPGIPDDIKPKLFEMFFTAGNIRSDARRGLGLGLALCRAIVAAHGGEIHVSDNIPHGSVFTFSLTREEENPDA
jgi:two-component system sensor histidine kinase KdpD